MNDWDFSERKDIIARLQSKSDAQHEGAVWELFLNSFFRHLGYCVSRDPLANTGKTPDFKVRKYLTSFYLEATISSDDPKSPAEKHWISLVSEIEKIERDDFYISLQPVRSSSITPKSRKFVDAINAILDMLDYDSLTGAVASEISEENISVGDWEIRIRPLRRDVRTKDGIFIAIRGNVNSPMITDLQDLRSKIEGKRKRYGKLDAPYVIAILENSFFASDDRWHRFGALFGQEAVQISTDGSSKSVRMTDGIWDIDKGKTSVEGLLLLSRLVVTLPHLELPELWINPLIPKSKLHQKIPLTNLMRQGDNYEVNKRATQWDGLISPPLTARLSRLLTSILLRLH